MRAAADLGRRPLLLFGAAVTAATLALTGCAAGQDAQTAQQTSVVDGTGFQAGLIDLRDIGVRAPAGPSYLKGSNAYLEGVLINNGQDSDELVSVSSPDATGVVFYPDGVTALLGLAPTATATAAAAASGTGSAASTGTASPSPSTSTSADLSGTPTDSGAASASASQSASPADSPSGSATGAAGATGVVGGSSSAAQPLQSVPVNPNENVQIGYANSQVQIVLTGLTADLAPGQTLPITFTFAKSGSVTATIAIKLVVDSTQTAPSIDTGKEGD